MQGKLGTVGSIVIAVAAVAGLKVWNKSQAHAAIKSELVELCDGEGRCVAAVEQHFDECFEEAYDVGSRHRAAELDAWGLADCLNEEAGTPLFAVADE